MHARTHARTHALTHARTHIHKGHGNRTLLNLANDVEVQCKTDAKASEKAYGPNTKGIASRLHDEDKEKETGPSGSVGTKRSAFKGMYSKVNGKWCSQISIDGKMTTLGTFENEVDAAQAFDSSARKLGRRRCGFQCESESKSQQHSGESI